MGALALERFFENVILDLFMFIRFGKDRSVKRTYGEDRLDLIGRMLAWVFM